MKFYNSALICFFVFSIAQASAGCIFNGTSDPLNVLTNYHKHHGKHIGSIDPDTSKYIPANNFPIHIYTGSKIFRIAITIQDSDCWDVGLDTILGKFTKTHSDPCCTSSPETEEICCEQQNDSSDGIEE